MNTKKRILVAPLDWGIGHATRCIPIIKALMAHQFEVVLAADGRPLHLLITEFPDLEIVRFPGYSIKYSKYLPVSVSVLLQLPKLLWNITKEHEEILDSYEEFPKVYQKEYFYLDEKKIMFYIMNKYYLKKPPKSYIDTIKEGYKNCNIDFNITY